MANNNHFDLTLDTTAPSGGVSVSSAYSTAANITVSCSATGAAYMKVWLVRDDDGAEFGKAWTNYSASKTITVDAEGKYVAHAIFMDDIGNESIEYTSEEINYDKTKPTITTFTVVDPSPVSGQPEDETNSLSNTITLVGEDIATDKTGVASGIKHFVVSCPQFEGTYTFTLDSGSKYTGTVEFKTGTTQGAYTISAYAVDFAGNVSATSSLTLYYDDPTEKDVVILKMRDAQGGTALTYTNKSTVYKYLEFKAETGETKPHIVGYRVWADGATEPTTWTEVTKGTETLEAGTVTVSGDGVKTFHARVIDDVGNTSDIVDYSFTLDQTSPAPVTITASQSKISQSGTITSSIITYTAQDTNIASWAIDVNGTALTSGTANITGGTATITAATGGMKAGENIIKITVTDKAGNVSTQTVIIELDTSAPTATWTKPANQWYNKDGGTDPNCGTAWTSPILDVSKEVATAYFWFSDVADDTSAPTTGAISLRQGANTIATTSISGNKNGYPEEKATTQYVHVYMKDDVGNIGYAHQEFKYDATAPTKPAISFSQDAYATTAAKVTISGMTDSASGLSQFRITGDITGGTTGWIEIGDGSVLSNYSVTLTSTDGVKSVKVIVRDMAGNASVESDAAECELDQTAPEGSLALRVKGTDTPKPSPSNVADVDLFITLNDDLITAHGKGYYKVWGAIKGGASTEDAAEWVAFDTAGSATKLLSVTCTDGDGTKIFYVKLKDNAGNISQAYSAQFVYDTTPIAVKAESEYKMISKVHTLRWSAVNTEIADKYNNEVAVTVTMLTTDGAATESDEKYIAYKAVAYKNKEAAAAGSHEDAPIEGCYQTYTEPTSGKINFTINGTNFEKALNGGTEVTDHSLDGIHYVTVYVQDEAGTWSKAAEF